MILTNIKTAIVYLELFGEGYQKTALVPGIVSTGGGYVIHESSRMLSASPVCWLWSAAHHVLGRFGRWCQD